MKIKTLRIKPVSSSELNKSGSAEIKLAKVRVEHNVGNYFFVKMYFSPEQF